MIDYKTILREAFGAPVVREQGIGACRVYVSLTDKEHATGIAKAAKALGKIFQRKAHYGLTNALYIGYDNFSGSELSRGATVVKVLQAAGIECYRTEEGD
jgi:phosphomannomutase